MSQELALSHQPRTDNSNRLFWDIYLGLMPILAVGPLMFVQAERLWHHPSAQLVPMLWVLTALLIFFRCRGTVTKHRARILVSITANALALSILTYAIATWSSNWAHISTAIFLAAWGLGRCSVRSWPEPVAWGLALAVTIPIPLVSISLDDWLTNQAATFLSITLDNLGIYHQLEAGYFKFSIGQIAVTSAGSPKLGVHLLICLSALWCWLNQRSLIHSLLLMASVPACLAISRYCTLALNAYQLLNQPVHSLFPSTYLVISVTCFLLSVFLILSIDRLLVVMLNTIPVTEPELLPIYAAVNLLMIWPHEDPLPISAPTDPEELRLFEEMQAQIAAERQSWLTMNWHENGWVRRTLVACSVLLFALCVISSAKLFMRDNLSSEKPQRDTSNNLRHP